MRLIKYFIFASCRRLLFGIRRWYSIRRLVTTIIAVFIFLTFLLLFYYSILVVLLNFFCPSPTNVIISLTSTPKRFSCELPFTIHSLLTQTKLPKEIRIYLSPTSSIVNQTNLTLSHLKMYIKKVDPSIVIAKFFDKLVRIQLENEDYGPATKFLPILKEFHLLPTNELKSQAIMICDDDHYYHPHTIDVLLKYSNKYKNSIVGLRGWRIREDLTWGVSGAEELSYHVIEAFRLSEIYRVGVITANNAYVIRPSFFDSHIYVDFNGAPNDIRRVDDIWLNGHASKRNIARLVVPACCSSIGVTRTHELENYLISHHMTRSAANDHALKWFNQTWEKDLWYKFKGENRPHYRSWWTKIYREWINIILRLKFIIYVGFR
ncbi:unnamed protein product [Rotaria magnacalcarata]|uniref:Uncharacterized protein n=2 Tax=Rotaria magnacalcarata TaxID=392030 RepID=A0A816GYB3_9BILA|nr:unnamed protein product [Rotaria magnacalcarata]CAF1681179.1 unnamed protein product [Rotaria magnacalcarata]CAF2110038.1 unnamed protein product [Rotaria magnacalcarata]CAF2217629.1 unnamed protein product [Rotaria magnacalcarata]CAF4001226.1 unnamed protein product [Rotaria magnacalcarata]